MAINRLFFFDTLRSTLAGGRLTAGQVAGANALVDAWEARRAGCDDRWLAYALATAWHETAFTLQPIDERGSAARFERLYGPRGANPARARAMGNTSPGDGARYRGRGFVQLTFKRNYAAMSAHLAAVFGAPVDLVARPEGAGRLDYAVEILFFGLESGAFTGRRFCDYFTVDAAGQPVRDDWAGARAMVNGRDARDRIAGYGRAFYAAIARTVPLMAAA